MVLIFRRAVLHEILDLLARLFKHIGQLIDFESSLARFGHFLHEPLASDRLPSAVLLQHFKQINRMTL